MRLGARTGALAVLAATLLAAGCGDEDAKTPSPAPAESETAVSPTVTTTTTADETTTTDDAGAPSSESGQGCDIGDGRDLGASYVTLLEVEGTSCEEGEVVVSAYHECRIADGGNEGTCEGEVEGFTCTEGERTGSPFQFSARVECTTDEAAVVHEYTQNA